MSRVIREEAIDVAEIKRKVSSGGIEQALIDLEGARIALEPLREGYPEGISPTVIRAIDMVQDALEDALEWNPVEESDLVKAVKEGKSVILDEADCQNLCQHCGAPIHKDDFLCVYCQDVEDGKDVG